VGARSLFCSEFCKQQFQRNPRAYDAQRPAPVGSNGWGAREVAYFSMEIALDNAMHTYAGGLGVLAGDTLASCAHLEVPVIAVTLAHRKGFFKQELVRGEQVERDAAWQPGTTRTSWSSVEIEGQTVLVRGWRHDVIGSSNYVVPVVLLDTDLPENTAEHRHLMIIFTAGMHATG
jgi:glycogen phosphorylase